MTDTIDCDVCVVGAGAAGLSVAAAAAQLGARTILVERARMGGDCLNTGCVPSKALLAAAKAAADARAAGRFGIRTGPVEVDFAAVMAHVAGVVEAIRPMDSRARFEGLGATVIEADARFASPTVLVAGAQRIAARRYVVAAGARPAVPPITGLADVPFLTSETIFENRVLPAHLVIVGAGPMGIEMAQAHARLGARVTILDAGPALPREDPEVAALLLRRLRTEGIGIREHVAIERVARSPGGIAVALKGGETLEASHLLVATGRRANVDGLGLEAAGVAFDASGIRVDARQRTTSRRIFAIGDVVAGAPQFTHAAGLAASVAVRNILFRLPAKVDWSALPRVVYAEPELAQVGLTEAEARARHGADVAVVRSLLAENDRAQAERATDGVVKLVARRDGHLLGATILAPGAGDLIQPWALALGRGLGLKAMAGMIAPYPTRSEAGKRAAVAFFIPRLVSERTKRLLRLLGKLG